MGRPGRWSWPWLGTAKTAGAAGLLVGLVVPVIGLAAGIGLVVYFTGAIVTVVRARWYSHIPYPLVYVAPVIASLALWYAAEACVGTVGAWTSAQRSPHGPPNEADRRMATRRLAPVVWRRAESLVVEAMWRQIRVVGTQAGPRWGACAHCTTGWRLSLLLRRRSCGLEKPVSGLATAC